jgi:diguanylate cyclase (GGDEF)-like protein
VKIDNFTLNSASEVTKTIEMVLALDYEISLIHISSIIHNTVLVQNLKQVLRKRFPDTKIALLKHKQKDTLLTIYSKKIALDDIDISDHILNQLQLQYTTLNTKLQNCKTESVNKYFIDQLTNMPNIYQLRKDLHDKEHFGLITIAIDNFITINNFYGAMVGDYVIEQIAIYLKDKIPNKLYRVSGTEFTVFHENELSFYELKDYLTQLYKKIKNISIPYQDNKITISLTIASAVNSDSHNMFSKVSMALKYAKDNKLPFWIYEDRMRFEDEYNKNLEISNMVRYAVENSKIIPYFQPIIDNKTMKIEKYECLARLIDENGNIISPILFIPIAKNIKVYNYITKMIIEKAFDLFEKNDFSFSINLSMEDIINTEMFDFILEKLRSSKASNRVIFEILESEAIQDFKKISRFIKEIKRFGAKIAIDDFGSGYSNFSYLIKMDVDFLKIDGSLIKDIDTDKNSFLVVETIVDFANKLNISTIAEFVHSSTVMDKVKSMDINYSQGYYIDQPLVSL